MLIGSPQCTAHSTWQSLNEARALSTEQAARLRNARAQSEVHIEFVASLYQEQIDCGRYFLHEHPRWATSWALKAIENVKNNPTVGMSVADQCQYGAEVQRGPKVGRPIKKPSGFMSNAPKLLEQLDRLCTGYGGDLLP